MLLAFFRVFCISMTLLVLSPNNINISLIFLIILIVFSYDTPDQKHSVPQKVNEK